MFVLVVVLALGAYMINHYLHQASHQASITIGDRFPAMIIQPVSAPPDKRDTMRASTKRVVMIVRNGCVFCDSLERSLDALLKASVSTKAPASVEAKHNAYSLFILSLDKAPDGTTNQALMPFRYVYHSEENDLYFSQTPQLYVLDSNNIVLKKHIGIPDTATLRGLLNDHAVAEKRAGL
mgnify:CR=1 FL=1